MCIEALDHKTPSVKAETASFLVRCFSRCKPATLPKKILKGFVAALLKVLNAGIAMIFQLWVKKLTYWSVCVRESVSVYRFICVCV